MTAGILFGLFLSFVADRSDPALFDKLVFIPVKQHLPISRLQQTIK